MPTRSEDLLRAVTPGLLLGAMLFGFLGLAHYALRAWLVDLPAAYVIVMATLALLFSGFAFMYLPLRALESEAARWRTLAASRFRFLR